MYIAVHSSVRVHTFSAPQVFWNAVVIWKVVRESRLRLFGYVLSLRICADALTAVESLSPVARTVCIRAIANSIVMTKNYHANMVLLLLRFQRLLHISDDVSPRYDDWTLFCSELATLNEPERNFWCGKFVSLQYWCN